MSGDLAGPHTSGDSTPGVRRLETRAPGAAPPHSTVWAPNVHRATATESDPGRKAPDEKSDTLVPLDNVMEFPEAFQGPSLCPSMSGGLSLGNGGHVAIGQVGGPELGSAGPLCGVRRPVAGSP